MPEGANLAEMILFADDDVTLLWGQIPPRFQSAVHNHTIWANILPIIGKEKNILYEEKEEASSDGGGLKKNLTQVEEIVVEPGTVLLDEQFSQYSNSSSSSSSFIPSDGSIHRMLSLKVCIH